MSDTTTSPDEIVEGEAVEEEVGVAVIFPVDQFVDSIEALFHVCGQVGAWVVDSSVEREDPERFNWSFVTVSKLYADLVLSATEAGLSVPERHQAAALEILKGIEDLTEAASGPEADIGG